MPWADIFKSVLGVEGGVHPALFLLCVCAMALAIYKLWTAYQSSEEARRKEAAEWSAIREAQYEKRLEESGVTRLALDHTSAGMATLVASVEARTKPISDMVNGLALLVASQEQSRDNFKEQADRIERHLEKLRGSQ